MVRAAHSESVFIDIESSFIMSKVILMLSRSNIYMIADNRSILKLQCVESPAVHHKNGRDKTTEI